MSSERIYHEGLTTAQVAGFIRVLADRLEGIVPDEADPDLDEVSTPDPGEFKKLKISVKRDLAGFTLKYKSKTLYKRTDLNEEEAEAPEDEEPITYKKLKKRMKESFKSMMESLMAEALPADAAVMSFLQDSKLMLSFPEKGGEYYDDYDVACTSFAGAFESGNLDACKSAINALDRLRKECHSRYK